MHLNDMIKSLTFKKTLGALTILFVLLIMGSHRIQAQTNAERAQAYYYAAEEAYNNEEYSKAVSYCDQVVEILGSSNARVEGLYVKCYYEQNNISKAKEALQTFSNLKPDASLSKEIALYIVRIEEAEKEEERRQELAAEEAEKKAEYDRTHTTCPNCYGSGTTTKKVDCYTCYGSGEVEGSKKTCPVCRGTGKGAVTYDFLGGRKTAGCSNCHNYGWIREKETCPGCHGEGQRTITKTCSICYGKGDVKRE